MSDGLAPFGDDELRVVLGDLNVLATTATRARLGRAGDGDRAALVALAVSLHRGEVVDLEELASLAERLEATGDAEAAAWAHKVHSDALVQSARLEEAAAAVERALAVAPEGFPAVAHLLIRRSLDQQHRGELGAAVRSVRRAYAEAVALGDDVAEAWAVAYLAFNSYQLGHLRRAEALCQRVLDVEARHLPVSGLLVAATLSGVVASLRGSWHDAAAAFDEAEAIVADQAPPLAWVVRTYRGVALGRFEPPMDDAELDELCRLMPAAGEEIVWRFAHATGVALAHHGQPDEGVARLRRALALAAPRWDRARIALHLGEALVEAGRGEEAVEPLEEAQAAFEAMDATYWLARTWVARGRAEPERLAACLAVAESFDDGDPGYARLFDLPARLWIDVGPVPSVRLGDVRIDFPGRQAEFAVYALAAAGQRGITVAELTDVLWPSPDPQRVSQRVRTLLWQVRRALGSEAWRLQREGDVLRLDVRGARVEGLEADEVLVEVAAGHPATRVDGADGDRPGPDGSGPDAGRQVLATWYHLGDEARDWVRSLAAARVDDDADG